MKRRSIQTLRAVAILICALSLLGCTGDDGGEDAGPDTGEPETFELPRDAAPHDERTEWWYYTGHLTDGERSWSFQLTIFYFVLDMLELYMCHTAVIDRDAGEHVYFQAMESVTGSWSSDPVELAVSTCRFQLGGDGNDHVVGVIPDGEEEGGAPGEWRLELDVEPRKPVALHGGDGVVAMSAAGGESWYYSYTRLAADGLLTTPEGDFEVTGQAWMDHQWGDFDVNEFQGWDWWSMQLDDDWEVMLFQFRDWEGELVTQAGSLIDPSGEVTELSGLEAFSVTSLRSWESPHTDGVYPLDWDIAIADGSWELSVRTDIDDQEMANPAQNYWEGPVTIEGSRGGEPVSGVGFVELTGYATDLLDP